MHNITRAIELNSLWNKAAVKQGEMLWTVNLFLLYTFMVVKVAEGDIICDNTSCPKETPYCTDAGCVSKCPNSSYVNGTRCVLDCGNHFVDGMECKAACPADKSLIQSKVFLIGNNFRKLRICLKTCDYGSFVYNNRCVGRCPDGLKFVIRNTCVATCPDDLPVINEKRTKNITYFECLDMCHVPKVIGTNNTCVNKCIEGDVVFNNTCVSKCPKGFEYLHTVGDGMGICLRDCEGLYYYGQRCVGYCPIDTILANKSCVRSCPSVTPFILPLNTYVFYDNVKMSDRKCVRECPTYMYIQNNTCSKTCYSHVLNRTCVQDCPASFPFSLAGRCIKRCPGNTYIHNFTCLTRCPHFSYYNECVTNCPNLTFRENDKCVNKCQQHIYYNGDECVSNCPRRSFIYNQTCFPVCPSAFPFSLNSQCLHNCPNNTFILNFTCIHYCPHFTNENECVTKCPNTTFIEDRKCVVKCRQDGFLKGDECVRKCPGDNYIFNKTCVKKCPLQAPYEENQHQISFYSLSYRNRMCVQQCNGSFALNFTCTKHCPNKVVYNQCVDECPIDMPFLEDQTCVEKCGDSKVANGSICIRKYECDDSHIVYNGNCLELCPNGMVWIGSTYNGNCCSVWPFYCAIIGSLILMVALFVAYVKFFRFQPMSCLEGFIRVVLKITGWRPQFLTRFQQVKNDETPNRDYVV